MKGGAGYKNDVQDRRFREKKNYKRDKSSNDECS